MPAPHNTEIATLKYWSVYAHCQKYLPRYINEAKIIYRVGCHNMRAAKQNQPSMSQDEIAEGMKIRLSLDQQWQKFISSKSHMTLKVYSTIEDIVARHIAWDYCQSIIR